MLAGSAGASALLRPLAARAQQAAGKRVSILINNPESDPEMQVSLAAFRKELERLGWTDGRNIRFTVQFTQGDLGQMQELAKATVASQPDLIFAHTTPIVAALRKETATIPIVFTNASDPVGSGFVESLAHPGGNSTGLLLYEDSIVGKWLGLLKEIAPNTTRVAFIATPKVSTYAYFLKSAQQVAPSLAMELVPCPADTATDVSRAIETFATMPNGGLFFPANVASTANREIIIPLAAKYRLPAVYAFRYFTAEGGLMSYGVSQVDLFRQAASYVDRILCGVKPAELPVEAPTKYDTVINLKTAKALGLTVPESLLVRADEVIE